jgi:predicted dehydrogenase
VSRLGCGIVGCGGAAADMCRAIDRLPETYVAAVHDRVAGRAAELGSAHGAAVHASQDELLRDPLVDVVYVALPHYLLAPTAEAALGAGKHVLVEKPMALDVAAIASLRRLADDARLKIAPVFELRASSVFREARRLVAAGAIGDVRAVRIRTVIDKHAAYWQSGPRGLVRDGWRARRAEAGGGVVLMNSIHQLDLTRYVTGLSFVRALAELATSYADVEVEDSAAAVLRLSNGALGTLVAAAHSPGATHEERIELDGSAGRLDLPDPSGPDAACVRVFLTRPWNDLAAGRWLELETARNDAYLDLLRDFVAAVERGSALPATADDAAAALATVLAVYDAAASSGAVDVEQPASPVA